MPEPIDEKQNEGWQRLSAADQARMLMQVDRGQGEELFGSLDAREQSQVLLALPEPDRRSWLRYLEPDDAADVIQAAPRKQQMQLLSLLDESTRREVVGLLAYAEDDAGGLMSTRYARVRPEMTVEEAISYLRKQAPTVETLYYIYVLDNSQRLLGVVSFRDLFSAERNQEIRKFMRRNVITVREDQDQEEVAHLFSDHSLLAIPVIGIERRMMGIVTVDDIVDVVREEASEDIQKIGGMEALDAPYLKISLWEMIQKRGGWLAILFLGEMLTATAMSYFEDEIAKAVTLALFIPLIISSGGNSGSQATTLVIRAMAVGEIKLRDWWRVIRRELAAGLALGSLLATIGLLRIIIWQRVRPMYGPHYMLIAATVGCSLIGVVLFGTIAGSMLPFVLRRVGLDPASASAPFVATLVDVTGLIIYFTVASLILGGTML